MYVPYIKQEEPLKIECQHFLDCINHKAKPISGGQQGLEMVRILEASSLSLKQQGTAIDLSTQSRSNPKPAKPDSHPAVSGNGSTEAKPVVKAKKRAAL